MLKTFAIASLANAIKIKDDPICDTYDGCDTLHYLDEGKTPYPVDYAVPDFGVDPDIADTQASLAAAESSLHHTTWAPSFKPPEGFKKDYPVPNLGIDHDVLNTATSLKVAEKITDHKWNWILKDPKSFKLDKGVPPE